MRYLSAARSVLLFFAVCFASVVALEALAGVPTAPVGQVLVLPRG